MNIPKQRLRLEVAYDLISKVNTDICNSPKGERPSVLPDMTVDVLRSILVLDARLKELEMVGENK